MKLKLKTMEEIWKAHKGLLRGADPNLKVDWNRPLPDNQEAYGLIIARQNQWVNPKDPVQLAGSNLEKTIERLVPQIEDVWGHKLEEKPNVELVAPEDFVDRINHYQRLVNEMFGYGTLFRSPPTMYLATSHKTLILPDKFIIRKPRSSAAAHLAHVNVRASLNSDNFDSVFVPWDRAYFEEVLAEEISHALFRKARGEWGEDYVTSMKAIGPEGQKRINQITEISAQIAKERLCVQNASWGLYVVADAIQEVWANKNGRGDYSVLDALSRNMSLMKASTVDSIDFVEGSRMKVKFFYAHPTGKDRKKSFGQYTEFRIV